MARNAERALSAVVDARRARVAALKVRGLSIRQIHEALKAEGGPGLNPATNKAWSTKVICEDLQALTEGWKAEAKRDIEGHKANQLEQLAAVRREAWDAWHSSRTPKKRTKTQRRTKPSSRTLDDGKVVANEKVSELASIEVLEMAGDPRYLAAVLEALQGERALLGLDAPRKLDANVKTPGVMMIPVVVSMDDWEKEALAQQAKLKEEVRSE